MTRTLIASSLALLLSTASVTLAQPHAATAMKAARGADAATSYSLTQEGGLFRMIGSQQCQVTSRVEEFKVVAHPDDSTAVYLVRDGALLALRTPTPDEVAEGSCPKAALTTLVDKLGRDGGHYAYKLVDRKETPISLVANDARGTVTAWDRKGVAVTVTGVTDMKINSCFGVKQKSFNSYVAFTIDSSGHVAKIGGKDPRNSKLDPATYTSLASFEAANHVCH